MTTEKRGGWIPWLSHLERLDVPPAVHAAIRGISALTAKKQILAIESLQCAFVDATPEGRTVTAGSRREISRFAAPLAPEILAWLQSFRSDDVFYDIGANCGGVVLRARGLHGDRLRVVAVEPGAANFASLARNVLHRPSETPVIALQAALMDTTGLRCLYYNRDTDSGSALHAIGEARDYRGEAFAPAAAQLVPVYALDDLIRLFDLPLPTRVKIDVDGHEVDVLRGARQTLSSASIEDVLVEIVNHDSRDSRLNAARQLLEAEGFVLHAVVQHAAPTIADYLFTRRGAGRRSAAAPPL